VLLVAAALLIATAAHAQRMFMLNLGGGGAAGPACNAGQLDWSDATGCNLTLKMALMK
jgi:hypothetical protein